MIYERFIYLLPLPPSSNEAHVHRTARIKNGPKAGKTYTARMLSKEPPILVENGRKRCEVTGTDVGALELAESLKTTGH